MTASAIQWTDAVWNPVTGCRKVSAGCEHCYAEGVARRFWGHQYPGGVPIPTPADGIVPDDARPPTTPRGHWSRPRRFTDVQVHPDRLAEPLRWRKPRRVFVNSMSDLFHEDVSDAFLDQVFAEMTACRGGWERWREGTETPLWTQPQQTFQVLTKRPERMRDYIARAVAEPCRWGEALDNLGWYVDAPGLHNWPAPNVHLGVSVEDQRTADERIPVLLDTPAAVRWVSAEPLLGPVDLEHLQPVDLNTEVNALAGRHGVFRPHRGTCERLDWVVIGGESGSGARPCDVDWIRALVAKCREAGVPAFVKQLGAQPLDASRLLWLNYPAREPAEAILSCDGVHVATAWNNGTWCTWDRDGIGLENAVSPDLASAKSEVEESVRRQQLCVARLKSSKGGDPSEWPEDLRVREFPP